jgi:hypothetical protein
MFSKEQLEAIIMSEFKYQQSHGDLEIIEIENGFFWKDLTLAGDIRWKEFIARIHTQLANLMH